MIFWKHPSPSYLASSWKKLVLESTPLVDSTFYIYSIGILLYVTHSRPYLSYAMSVISRYMQEPHELNWKETKHIFHYVQVTREFWINYYVCAHLDLISFTYSNWDSDPTDRKSTSGFVFMLGSGPIYWLRKKKEAFVLSSVEADYQGDVNAVI